MTYSKMFQKVKFSRQLHLQMLQTLFAISRYIINNIVSISNSCICCYIWFFSRLLLLKTHVFRHRKGTFKKEPSWISMHGLYLQKQCLSNSITLPNSAWKQSFKLNFVLSTLLFHVSRYQNSWRFFPFTKENVKLVYIFLSLWLHKYRGFQLAEVLPCKILHKELCIMFSNNVVQ